MLALALPRLDGRIPRSVLPEQTIRKNSLLSRFLAEAQAFSEDDLPETWENSLAACQVALDRWIKREVGPLHCLQPEFVVRVPCQNQYPQDRTVYIRWHEGGMRQWAIGTGLQKLHSQVPGLGRAVLQTLRHQSNAAYPLFTPDVARDTASYLHWDGCDDEEYVLDMTCGDDTAERESVRETMITASDFNESYPQWVLNDWNHRQRLAHCKRFLKRCLNQLADPSTRKIASDALALSRLHIGKSYLVKGEGFFIGYGGLLSWQKNDLTVALFDDLYNTAMQDECFDEIGAAEFPLATPLAFSQWQRNMRPQFRAISLIDRLIYGLSM